MQHKEGVFDRECQKDDVKEEVFCMTSGNGNHVFIVGSLKSPNKAIPVVSKSRIESALKSAERYKKK